MVKRNDASFHQKLENIRYDAALPITETISGTSKEKLFEDLGLEPVQYRH